MRIRWIVGSTIGVLCLLFVPPDGAAQRGQTPFARIVVEQGPRGRVVSATSLAIGEASLELLASPGAPVGQTGWSCVAHNGQGPRSVSVFCEHGRNGPSIVLFSRDCEAGEVRLNGRLEAGRYDRCRGTEREQQECFALARQVEQSHFIEVGCE